LTVGDVTPYLQSLYWYQEKILSVYRTPLLFVTVTLVIITVLFAYKYRLQKYLMNDKKFVQWCNRKYGEVDYEWTRYRVMFWIERTVLWGLVLCTMLVFALLFVKIEVMKGWSSGVLP
jgi:hypothetical protein